MLNHLQDGLGKQPRESGLCETTTQIVFFSPFAVQNGRSSINVESVSFLLFLLSQCFQLQHRSFILFSVSWLLVILIDCATMILPPGERRKSWSTNPLKSSFQKS